jgi:tetratricopeptide (TPR) repeat protein
VKVWEARVRAEPAKATTRKSLMLAYAASGDLHWGFGQSLGNREKALESFRKMAAEAERLRAADPRARNVRLDFAMSLMRYAGAFPPRDPEAIRLLAQSLEQMDQIGQEDPGNTSLRRQQIDLCLRLAARYKEFGRSDPAIATWRRAISIGEPMAAQDAANVSARTWLLRAYMPYGDEMLRRGQRGAALDIVARAERQMKDIPTADTSAPVVELRKRTGEWIAKMRTSLGKP